jgi:hypothetical protein
MGRRKKTETENRYSSGFKKIVLESYPSNRKVKKYLETNDFELGRILAGNIQISIVPVGKKILKTTSLNLAKKLVKQEILKEKIYNKWNKETSKWVKSDS